MVTAIMDNQMALEYEQIIRTRSGEIFLESEILIISAV